MYTIKYRIGFRLLLAKAQKRELSRNFTRYFSSMERCRNIGISAHIDSGKTTLTERILYYTGRIDSIHEVRGSDGVGAKMDSMELERERGITIQSASTYCKWRTNEKEYDINIIDTPGHVDFTIEVERALRVLDGAILLVCSVAGVQSQTLTVNKQMDRYSIPRIFFLNKMDREGADVNRSVEMLQKRMGLQVSLLQLPIFANNKFEGIVDIINGNAYYFKGTHGETLQLEEVPAGMKDMIQETYTNLLEKLADVDDIFAEHFLENNISVPLIKEAIRRSTLNHKMYPVLLGSAKGNKGVQLLLDAVCEYLPHPFEVKNTAYTKDGDPITIDGSISSPLLAYGFKIQDTHLGQLTYLRIYQGTLRKGLPLHLVEDGKRHSFKKLYRMHSNESEEIQSANSGDIVAISGLKCNSGVTFTDGRLEHTMAPLYVPLPVVSLALKKVSHSDLSKLSKALARFQREDPTFKITIDDESKETIMSGMGELHLGIYIERMKREYGLELETGKPIVNYRETVTTRVDFDYTHKRQSGGAGQYGKIIGYIEPIGEDPNDHICIEFVNKLIGNDIPPSFIPSIENGFRECAKKGLLSGRPMINTRFVLTDGASHEVDSSDIAFKLAAFGAFNEVFMDAEPIILEPIMSIEVVSPSEYQSQCLSTLTKRKGVVTNTGNYGDNVVLSADVPLRNMFGYITDLRAATKGQGEFTMEFKYYQPMNKADQDEAMKEYQDSLKK
ncbi:translation elongation factor G1, putative [Theileria equi strain WA]|uniref:Elongation factor G, mitochondrial n=1 Tax=Theileria equi strain WA TaxID=1537102 RepID=L1LCW3_THEEQ|nr:translation elongation factor G1, putative [Theileria equi strain WA]EKX73124.1 translation elongation factor G1, putative [Theileria equi strain WA]|eukprot:XP_004832576.1 translation elongation factor G1, putative [Theileria equi strain WA]